MNNLINLNGKNVVLTGASGILGKHFAKAYLSAGATLQLLDIESNSLNVCYQNLSEEFKGKVFSYQCNVADEKSISATISEIEKVSGDIHVLHNNAATKSEDLNKFFEAFENYSLEEWRKIMSVNIDGMFLMAKHVGKHMVERNIKGSIIQTSSIYGDVAPDQRIYEGSYYLGRQINTPAVYTVSKSAVNGLTKYLASYWGHKGIRVNTLSPGGVESGQNEEFIKKYSYRIPLGRMGSPEDLVGAAVFLASDASSYVTGQNYMIDGGLSVW